MSSKGKLGRNPLDKLKTTKNLDSEFEFVAQETISEKVQIGPEVWDLNLVQDSKPMVEKLREMEIRINWTEVGQTFLGNTLPQLLAILKIK